MRGQAPREGVGVFEGGVQVGGEVVVEVGVVLAVGGPEVAAELVSWTIVSVFMPRPTISTWALVTGNDWK